MDGRDRSKRKDNTGETSKQGAKKARDSDAIAVVKSTDALEIGGASRGSTDDVSGTVGGDGASSLDTSLTLDIGATATRMWWRNSQKVGPQACAKSECASNSDGAVIASTLSDGHNIPAAEGSVPVVDAAPSTGSSRNDPDAFQEIPVPDDECCPACLIRMGLPEDHPTYHICLCEVCLTRAAVCPICDIKDQIGSP